MKKGILTENILDRSVNRLVHHTNREIESSAGPRVNCAVFSDKNIVMTPLLSVPGGTPMQGRYAIYRAILELVCRGGQPTYVQASLVLPETLEESQLKAYVKELDVTCAACNLAIGPVSVTTYQEVDKPVIQVLGVGELLNPAGNHWSGPKKVTSQEKQTGPYSILQTGYVGLEATSILARQKMEELHTRYSQVFLQECVILDKNLNRIPGAAVAGRSDVRYMQPVAEGGVYGALWELAKMMDVGLEIDLKAIPIKQETIEICEFFDLNPYELLSGGSCLIVTNQPEEIIGLLEKDQIPVTVIGKTTETNDKIVYNGDEGRYLEPRKPDQIYKVL